MPPTVVRLLLALPLALCMATARAEGPPTVVVSTSHGDMVIELDPEAAPLTVENFLAYVDDGFYDGTVFHRVINGFMVQGGGYGADLARRETRPPIRNEADNGLRNVAGSIAMARTGQPHSATAQFFINLVDNDFLDHRDEGAGWGYAVFGRVVEGSDVLQRIGLVPTGPGGPFAKDVPREPVVIENVRRLPAAP